MPKPRPPKSPGIPMRDPRDRSFLGPLPLDPRPEDSARDARYNGKGGRSRPTSR
jgi:hypothetical protein